VWSPYNTPASWRPYQLGHWIYTDYGWTWASDEDYGWAVYHYGRWCNNPSYGWVWVPGVEWGPAWVAWHEGGGWVGWAPLPYQARWRAGFGLDWGGLSINVAIGSSDWYFVQTRDFVSPSWRYRAAPPTRNVTLIQVTQNVTNYTYVDNRIVDRSVRVEHIGKATGRTVPRYRIRQADSPSASSGGKVRGQEFVVYRPAPGRMSPPRREVTPGHDGMRPAQERRPQGRGWERQAPAETSADDQEDSSSAPEVSDTRRRPSRYPEGGQDSAAQSPEDRQPAPRTTPRGRESDTPPIARPADNRYRRPSPNETRGVGSAAHDPTPANQETGAPGPGVQKNAPPSSQGTSAGSNPGKGQPSGNARQANAPGKGRAKNPAHGAKGEKAKQPKDPKDPKSDEAGEEASQKN
jgi:hypothetical protein